MVILKMSSNAPLDFGGKVKKKCFLKWPPSVPGKHAIFLCGGILTNKRSILTNSCTRIPFLTFVFTRNTFLTLKFKMAAVNNTIHEQF